MGAAVDKLEGTRFPPFPVFYVVTFGGYELPRVLREWTTHEVMDTYHCLRLKRAMAGG